VRCGRKLAVPLSVLLQFVMEKGSPHIKQKSGKKERGKGGVDEARSRLKMARSIFHRLLSGRCVGVRREDGGEKGEKLRTNGWDARGSASSE